MSMRSNKQEPRARVVYAVESTAMGGTERSTALLIRHLDRSRFEPRLLCPAEPDIQPLVDHVRSLGVPVRQCDFLTGKSRLSSGERLFGLVRELRAQRADILHIQLPGGSGGRYLKMAAFLAGVPVVIVTVRGAALHPLSLPDRLASAAINRLVTVHTVASQHNRDLQTRNAGLGPDRVRLIYNGIAVDEFDACLDSCAARLALGLPPVGPVIGTIARLDPQKGLPHFLDMAEHVLATVPRATFCIAGEGPQRSDLEAIIRDKGLTDRVLLLGHQTDAARCLAAMDIFVLPSVYEPFGLVLAEAMAMRKPVVATSVGGIPEVVADGVTGMLVPSGDGAALADAVLGYLADPTLARRHGRAGRARAEEHFSMERVMREMEGLYDEMLSRVGKQAIDKPARA
jgi:glycosyltransferase involved in cell wall biosynthesis